MISIDTVSENSKQELFNLLKVCFNESSKINNWFFNMVNYQNYLVVKKDNKIISSLYMMESKIKVGEKNSPVYYIYAACTLPAYRGQGAMSMLLNFANEFAREKGCQYTILLPSDSNKYLFYKKCDYQKFFQIRSVSISKKDSKKVLSNNFTVSPTPVFHSYEEILKIRNSVFTDDGSVIWGQNHISRAHDLLNITKGKFVFSKNGYALCIKRENAIFVNEIADLNNDYQEILSNIFSCYGKHSYNFRLNTSSDLFSGLGKIEDFGMIRPTNFQATFLNCQHPYLGLALD